MWNGFSMISKRPELTDGMMETLDEAERTLMDTPGKTAYIVNGCADSQLVAGLVTFQFCVSLVNEFSVDDRCVILLLKGLCLKNQGQIEAAEDCFQNVFSM